MKIAVLGAGHVGLVTAVTLAKLGREITVFDADPSKNELLRQSKPPFHEPGLDELVVEQTALGNLVVAQSAADAIARSDVVFVCVGTPARADGATNLAAVEATTRSIARGAQTGTVVAEKSTVPAGTAERIAQTLARERPGTEFHVVSNPEFLREGSAVADSLSPERILIGGSTLRGSRQCAASMRRSSSRAFPTSRPTYGQPS
jgi:UDPglucose 6-dehydrogenase